MTGTRKWKMDIILAALTGRPQTASDIAAKTGLTRETVHQHIKNRGHRDITIQTRPKSNYRINLYSKREGGATARNCSGAQTVQARPLPQNPQRRPETP